MFYTNQPAMCHEDASAACVCVCDVQPLILSSSLPLQGRLTTTCRLSCSFLPCRRLGFNLFLSGIAPLIINGTFSEQCAWPVGGSGVLPPVLLPTQTA